MTTPPPPSSPPSSSPPYRPGQRVTVTQQIPQRDEVWTQAVTGTVQRFEQRKTGSWFAHAKDDKLWLDRLVVKRDDGEIVVCNLDQYSNVQIDDDAAQPPSPLPDDPSDDPAEYDTGHGPRRGYTTAGAQVDHGPAGKDNSGAA